jgi:hypothetical protein
LTRDRRKNFAFLFSLYSELRAVLNTFILVPKRLPYFLYYLLVLKVETEKGVEKCFKTIFADPDLGSGIQCSFDPLYPGWKNSGSGISMPDHISESFVTITTYLKFFVSRYCTIFTLNPRWKNQDPVFGINIPDPQHCFCCCRISSTQDPAPPCRRWRGPRTRSKNSGGKPSQVSIDKFAYK